MLGGATSCLSFPYTGILLDPCPETSGHLKNGRLAVSGRSQDQQVRWPPMVKRQAKPLPEIWDGAGVGGKDAPGAVSVYPGAGVAKACLERMSSSGALKPGQYAGDPGRVHHGHLQVLLVEDLDGQGPGPVRSQVLLLRHGAAVRSCVDDTVVQEQVQCLRIT
ncbi:hypothetical protein SCOCK_720001 [Actinacidiphila cocklensis]|uniref:Uncharacterized protein n=1 Tax=Actinacidiphila cocklensis TaxID=887465 RepID=A0A9W4EBE5_9ACTN|nr:hypothetical protein SCOCK_720001 [Actinacidiphila cocklensis]